MLICQSPSPSLTSHVPYNLLACADARDETPCWVAKVYTSTSPAPPRWGMSSVVTFGAIAVGLVLQTMLR